MYISKKYIKGFRNFHDNEIQFNDGINVIIGHNNSGKTNLIKALSLVIDQGSKHLDIDDFNKHTSIEELKGSPPKISIALTITQSKDEDLNSDDLVTVGNWLIKLEPPYESLLTYEFFLPEKEKAKYLQELSSVTDIQKAWQIIKYDFSRLFTYKIFGGDTSIQNTADSESLRKFDFQFLDAIRDVERDMFSGRNTLLRDVLDFFMDYEIKSVPEVKKSKEVKEAEIKLKKQDFSIKADKLLSELKTRMEAGKKQILSYATETGATFNNATPNFEGSISEVEMFSALKLIVEYETGIKIPATHNGLGYNNLIYMSLLLAKMQVNSDGNYLGGNAKVFPILVVEEPEAHLHPAMQYKFLKFLRENKDTKKKVRQIFVTTHSTQITSAVSLDEIICLHNENGNLIIGYPGKVFSNNDSGKKAKAYVQRFLDATKSDMLFAQKVILVEGIAEQLLLSVMAKYLSTSLEDKHIAVINVGGRYFEYFLNLFDSTKSTNTIPKKIACLTDRDPERKGKSNGFPKFQKCYPFEYNQDATQYGYQDNATSKITQYKTHENIRFFSQDADKGKTFEYDLALHNPTLELLVTDSMKNPNEIKELMKCYRENKSISDFESQLNNSNENERIKKGIDATNWVDKKDDDKKDHDKKKAIIAARYLNSVSKGENALELAYALEENQKKEEPEPFHVPDYIKEAIKWICQ